MEMLTSREYGCLCWRFRFGFGGWWLNEKVNAVLYGGAWRAG